MPIPSLFRFLPALFFLCAAFPVFAFESGREAARETVIEDVPGRLILEVDVPMPKAQDAKDGHRVVVPGFGQASAVGAPDLPVYTFQVAAGGRLPAIGIDALEWSEVEVPKGLAGVRRYTSPTESEPAHDAAAFAAARGLSSQVSEPRLYRGMPLRGVSLGLATFHEGSARVRVLKKFRVTVTFPSPASVPAVGVRPWLIQAGVKNLNGGQYLVSLPGRSGLRKRAVAYLSSGSFLKIRIGDRNVDAFDEDGVYALTYAAAKQAGLPSAKDIQSLRLYTGPQSVLGLPMDSLVAPTLTEIPIRIAEGSGGSNGNPNGTFDEGDTLLFYAHGTSVWKPIPGATGAVQWEFALDPYSFDNFYYLDWNGTNNGALRLDTLAFIPAATTVTSAPHYLRAEKELGTGVCDPSGYFDSESGYGWYWYYKGPCNPGPGPGFASLAPTLNATQLRSATTDSLRQLVSDSAVWFGTFLFPPSAGFNGNLWSRGVSLPSTAFFFNGYWSVREGGVNNDSLGLDSLQWSSTADSRFDGYTVRYIRRLTWSGKSRRVFPAQTGQRIVYRIENAAPGLQVLRVVSGVARKVFNLQRTSTTAEFSDLANVGEDVHYFISQAPLALSAGALTLESAPTATGVIRNLSTGDDKNPEYLILAPQSLLPEALTLRTYRDNEARSPRYSTAVVRTEDIYREWSGGRLSPVAIRDFLRWALNRWGSGGAQGNLKFVVLYGDGHYDYRNLRNGSSINQQPNNVPPFEWNTDTNPMSTDDFFGILDSGETWQSGNLDVSLGRLPFQTREQARVYQEKMIRYENPATSGEWRSRILLIGDDDMQREAPDDRGNFQHTAQAEVLGNYVLSNDPGMRKEQVYMFDYPRNSSYLKPEATQDLINTLNRGVLYSTYFGHGAYNQLADEVLLKTSDGLGRFRNADKYFLMTMFSCTVGRFDKLADEGMSEQFLRASGIGAIATFSASRESYPDPNGALGYQFSARLFESAADSVPRGVGDAARLAKNSMESSYLYNTRKYILQGEPVLVINRPGLGVDLGPVRDTLQALGCDTIRGKVHFGSGKGKVNLRIVSADVPQTYFSAYQNPQSVLKPGQVLFERTVDYNDSVFSMGYFLPKSVPFGDTTAKMQIFAWDAEQLRESAVLLANRRIVPGGTCVVDHDGLGPRIAVTGCNTQESGAVDFPDKVKISLPYCLQITVNDTVGGVLSGEGPDEGTTVEVVGSVAPYHPQAGVDDLYTKNYQLTLTDQDLSPGTHLLKVSARDGFGNLGTRQLSLEVSADTVLRFTRAFNVPNPMKRHGTTFYFQTTLPSEAGGARTSSNVDRVDFHLRIFNQQGNLVQEFRNAVSGETKWDGKDAWGRPLANGVYFYHVTASWDEIDGSPQGGRQTSRKNVLVISR